MSHHPRYFFYKTFGDAVDLLKSIPEDVIPVPFGCGEEKEARRKAIEEELGISVSHFPCVVYWRAEEEVLIEADGSKRIVPPHWATYIFDEKYLPWTWSQAPY